MALRDWSIKRRLTAVILLITLAALASGFTVVGWRQVEALRQDRVATTALIAEVVGNYSVSSLAFADGEDAAEVLERLHAFPEISAAALYDADGVRFATWSREGHQHAWAEETDVDVPRRELRGDLVEIRHKIIYDGEVYGAIHLLGTTGSLADERRQYVMTLASIAVVILALSAIAAQLLGRLIGGPILRVAGVARRIAAGDEPAPEVPRVHGGELGVLTEAFDVMLKRLAARDRELRSSHAMLRALIDASPMAIIGLDHDRRVTLWNQGAAALFGVAEADAVGRSIGEVVPAPGLAAIWEQCAAPTGLAGAEVRLDRDDDALELTCSAAPLRGPDGELAGAVVMVVDDTERRLAAQALAERATQLQRAQKMEVVGRLAGGVAHDFNNLLTVVMASCQLLGRRLEDRLQVHVRNILDAAERGAALSRRLLAFSKQQAIDRRVLDPGEVVTGLERMLKTVLGEHTMLRLDLADLRAGVEIDQGQLEQVLLNLALNARDAMPEGGELIVRTRVHAGRGAEGSGAPSRMVLGDWIALSVSDSGSGMSSDVVNRVFEPFFTTKAHGTGLGLATALAIVRDAGGEMTVESEPGEGTTFTLWMPMVHGEIGDDSSTKDVPLPVGHETILLVEDEPGVRSLARQILEEAGYVVLEACDGADGLERARTAGHIELLVTDVVMPRMSGPTMARELIAHRPGLPVLYMSGYVGEALAPLGIDEGPGPALLQKPFTADVLLRRVREILDVRGRDNRSRRPSSMMGVVAGTSAN